LKNINKLALVGLAISCAGIASASDVTTLDFSQGWGYSDVSGGGSAAIVSSPSADSDGALQLHTIDANSRAKVFFGTGGSLGTLGDLANGGQISFDLFRDAASTANSNLQISYKLYVTNSSGQSGSITWENVYNGNNSLTNTWVTKNIIGDDFWIRSGGVNYDQVVNMRTLGEWISGGSVSDGSNSSIALGANTSITGIEVAAGGGWSGEFIGSIDHMNLTFGNGGASYQANFAAVPEPASMAALGLGALALIRRRRNKKS
jgi:hypothetical protein